jgi:hypothetical protein
VSGWRIGRVSGWLTRDSWFAPSMCWLFFCRQGASNVRLRLCGFLGSFTLYLRNGWSVNLRAIENCIFSIRSIERNMRPILRAVYCPPSAAKPVIENKHKLRPGPADLHLLVGAEGELWVLTYIYVWLYSSYGRPRMPPWTACIHFADSYPFDVSHLSFNFSLSAVTLVYLSQWVKQITTKGIWTCDTWTVRSLSVSFLSKKSLISS